MFILIKRVCVCTIQQCVGRCGYCVRVQPIDTNEIHWRVLDIEGSRRKLIIYILLDTIFNWDRAPMTRAPLLCHERIIHFVYEFVCIGCNKFGCGVVSTDLPGTQKQKKKNIRKTKKIFVFARGASQRILFRFSSNWMISLVRGGRGDRGKVYCTLPTW